MRVTSRGDNKLQGGNWVFLELQFLHRSLSNLFLTKAQLPHTPQLVFNSEASPVPSFQIWDVPEIALTRLFHSCQHWVIIPQQLRMTRSGMALWQETVLFRAQSNREKVDPGHTCYSLWKWEPLGKKHIQGCALHTCAFFSGKVWGHEHSFRKEWKKDSTYMDQLF